MPVTSVWLGSPLPLGMEAVTAWLFLGTGEGLSILSQMGQAQVSPCLTLCRRITEAEISIKKEKE